MDHTHLTDKAGEPLFQKHLEKLILVQMIVDFFDGDGTQEKMLYFLEDETIFKLNEQDLLLK